LSISNDRRKGFFFLERRLRPSVHHTGASKENVMANQQDQGGGQQQGGQQNNQGQQTQRPGQSGQQGGSKENNPGNFANDREKASEAGRKGGQS
jgi:general stress protein YciG